MSQIFEIQKTNLKKETLAMEMIDWDKEVSLFYNGDKLDRNALLNAARADASAISNAINMQDVRSGDNGDNDGDDKWFLADFAIYARRALCNSGKPKKILDGLVASPFSKAALITLSELIWPEIPDEFRKSKNMSIALALDVLEKELINFCKV